MSDVITLTTDFGTEDAYVGTMKGVILGINPDVKIVDICHTIKPQNIFQAAFLLDTVYRYFPAGTIHMIVVDPGVGTERKAVILKTSETFFVAPDNGVLSYVLDTRDNIYPAGELKTVAISNPRFWLSPVSTTFHGRDIFAPVAAYLSLGTSLHEFGEPIPSLVSFPIPKPQHEANSSLTGQIVHIDRFGNLITNIIAADLPEEEILIDISSHHIEGLSSTYADGGELLALIGSSGRLEIATKNRNAAESRNVSVEIRQSM